MKAEVNKKKYNSGFGVDGSHSIQLITPDCRGESLHSLLLIWMVLCHPLGLVDRNDRMLSSCVVFRGRELRRITVQVEPYAAAPKLRASDVARCFWISTLIPTGEAG